ncbi:ABC transporter substrate-binding protein [Nonomuraea sp. NPDC051941]|uniref:ABC transporter substrate-binding protein n=1 Tax=Nonomuraea sp. NPDC051941 TaxID=3364373 RepID=UPI0037C6CE75
MNIPSKAAALAASALLLTACSGRVQDNTSATSGGQVKLSWWMVTQNADTANAAFKSIIGDFEKQNPNIKVDLQYRAVDAHKDALRTTAGSSSGPDIYYNWAGPGLGGELVKSGVSLDLSKYYQQYKWADRFNPSTLAAYKQYGGYHGVPWTQRTEVVYYHKDQFAKAGISAPPTTYQEWATAAQKLKDAGLTPITMGGKDNWHVMRLLDTFIETNCGAELGDKLNTRSTSWAGQPCVDKSFEQLKQWSGNYFNKGFAGLPVAEAGAMFHSGKSAMQLEGDWFTQQNIDAGDDQNNVGVFPMPTGTDRLYGFSEGMYISKSSKHPDEAAKFLDFFTSAAVEGKYLGVFSSVPVNKETKGENPLAPINTQIAELTGKAKGFFLNNDQNFPTDVTTEYWRIQNGVTSGSIAPKEAGALLQKFIDTHKD